MHDNTAIVYEDLNSYGWTTYVSYNAQEWSNFAFSTARITYLLTLSQMSDETYDIDQTKAAARLRSLYPYEREFDNRFYLYIEMVYEFIIGTQIMSNYILNLCEIPVSEFFDDF